MTLPILYSFRRCPYAIRARMALNYAGVRLELREVLLKDKPRAMLIASSKATVPVLVLSDGKVIDESVDVMRWALEQQDIDHWWQEKNASDAKALVDENDFVFKPHLDHYKYADRFPARPQSHYRGEAETFLRQLEQKLEDHTYLMGNQPGFSDVAIFPFVRQFAFVDKPWFDRAPYPALQHWLQWFLDSRLFTDIMIKFPVWLDGATPQILPLNRP